MSARTRLYTVRDRKTGAGRLVRAPSPATAVRIMADSLYFVDVATQDECVALAALGVLDEAPSAQRPAEDAADRRVLPEPAGVED